MHPAYASCLCILQAQLRYLCAGGVLKKYFKGTVFNRTPHDRFIFLELLEPGKVASGVLYWPRWVLRNSCAIAAQ